MKRTMPLAAILVLMAGGATTAKAVEMGAGRGGVYGDPDGAPCRYRERDYDAYKRYDRYGRCRVVIDRRTNRFGEDVTVRRRICD